ncbi:protein ENDOSPERM DEFECTIVE 1-like [Mangifera indica]|uniref:protein ENDOSPERM DEFECTIVE 1-like n=1 Tax=Mangifera indica TaxID=29780 RepID=UPI001CFA583D|nr:protein ENDOSPERM DEFECTIVE 1-like [Mangifera indica]
MSQIIALQVEQAAASTTTKSTSTPVAAMAPPPPPPPTHRRPRVREVSSRFMSPAVPSSSSSSSLNHKLHQQLRNRRNKDDNHGEVTSSADENYRPIETARSLESPFLFQWSVRHQQQQPHQRRSGNSLRPDTPTLTTSPLISSSTRPRLIQRTGSGGATAATKLLQSLSSQDDTSSIASDDNSSQLSESDMLPTVSNRLLGDRNINRVNSSLNLPLSTASVKGSEKSTPAVSRSYTNSGKLGGYCLPPVALPQTKAGIDARKIKKVSSHQEDIQSLKLLHNRYLQWRFANAKAEASMQAQRRETERTLYFCLVNIAEMYESVKRKRIELEILRRRKMLLTILEAQMPYLDNWCALEGDYSNSLSEGIQALVNASLQLPVSGNVTADVGKVGEALNSSMKLMETIILNVQSFMPKAEEVEFLMSELAKVTGGETLLIEECGGLLSKTHAYQVEECSLRGEFLQLHKRLTAKIQGEEIKYSTLSAVHMR